MWGLALVGLMLAHVGCIRVRGLGLRDPGRTVDEVAAEAAPGRIQRVRGGQSKRVELEQRVVSEVDTLAQVSGCVSSGSGSSPTQLVFIHIPRTGGTTIEECKDPSSDADSRWGVSNPHIRGLYTLPQLHNREQQDKCYKQHVPPAFLPEIYAGAETFCAVRNPYERMISQFGFAVIFAPASQGLSCSRQSLNAKLREDLRRVKQGNRYFGDCHYLPQAAFVYGLDPHTAQVNDSIKYCKHILRTETLRQDFAALMDNFNYSFELTTRAGGTKSQVKCEQLTTEDLEPEVRQLVEEIYAEDFRLFGYELVQTQ